MRHIATILSSLALCLGLGLLQPLMSAAHAGSVDPLSSAQDVAAQEVKIPGPTGALAGLALPVSEAQHAVVIVPGSGPVDRDGNGPSLGLRTDSYRLLAEALADAGVATIRVDKRGFFSSAEAIDDPEDVTIAAYAQDLRAWVDRAAQLAPCVWIAGHSEGGLVALVAARDAPPAPLCGLILLATPGRPVGQLLLEQTGRSSIADQLMPELTEIVTALEVGQTRDPAEISGMLRPMFTPGVQRYMVDLFAYDPAGQAGHWRGPALIVQGDADLQVTATDAALLAAAMPQAQQQVLTGATHMLKTDVPGQPAASYTDPELPLHPDLIPAILAAFESLAETAAPAE